MPEPFRTSQIITKLVQLDTPGVGRTEWYILLKGILKGPFKGLLKSIYKDLLEDLLKGIFKD